MGFERIWSPWRKAYVTAGAREPGCVLCRALEQAADPDSLVVQVAALNFVVMNLYPYNAGHVMIAPRRHLGSLAEATSEELSEMMALTRRLESVMARVYTPDGINLGLNLGKAAGAGVADHIHLHMLPRWVGDTNFMTTVGGTRVIPEDPVEACARLKAEIDK
ncbi:MAG TPA: HIT domain-containing protein [Vicinamibacteria bacterium]